MTPTRRRGVLIGDSGVLATLAEHQQDEHQDQEGREDEGTDEVGVNGRLGVLGPFGSRENQGHGVQSTVRRQRTCPDPTMTYVVVVISGSPIGPRA